MKYKTLYVGGGFDVLHKDHKIFIENGMKKMTEKYGSAFNTVIGLKSDARLSYQKGENRPFFAFDWRKDDIKTFLLSKKIDFRIICSSDFNLEFLDLSNVVVQVRSDYINEVNRLKKMGIEGMCIDSVDSFHTTDIAKKLLRTQKKSNCLIRKVGALLIRGGRLVASGYSGAGNCNLCNKYKAYSIDGGRLSKKIACDYPHAEEICLKQAKKDDDLILTDSPCMNCAKKIASSGIKRVVYLKEYHNLEAVTYLKNNNVTCRKAGI